jgi:hypothetical protein
VMRTIRIGSGAGYSGDRIEPAVERRTSEFKPFVYRSRMTAVCAQRTAGIGRVEVWRSDVRLSMSVPPLSSGGDLVAQPWIRF